MAVYPDSRIICPHCGGYIELDEHDRGVCDTCDTYADEYGIHIVEDNNE